MFQPTETARRLHDEVQRNPEGQEAAFSIAQDREQEAECQHSESERLEFLQEASDDSEKSSSNGQLRSDQSEFSEIQMIG